MATLQAPEDGYNFVEEPSEDFFCPVTFDLLREPYLTPCCGNHLSPAAVTTLQGQPCPVCKEPNLNPVHDKFFKRMVHDLKVRCPNKSLGCEWVGELGSLDRHLNSVEGECQFVTVACPYSCGDSFQRCQLQEHKINDCPNRPFTCQYCNHEAIYITVTNHHWPICTKHPADCPNKCLGCQWAGERGDLDQHLNDESEEGECQFVTVACPYSCGHDFKRCELKDHKMNDCPNRLFTCEYCDHEATYTAVTTEHWPVCEKYPMQCPNACGGDTIERQYLVEHLHEACPLLVVQCEFSYAGCEVQCQRQHMQDHVNEKVKAHLSLVSEKVSQQLHEQEELDTRIIELEDKCEQQDTGIEESECKLERQDTRIEELECKLKQQDTRIEELECKLKQQGSTIQEQEKPINQQQKQIVALMSALTRLALDVKKPLAPVFVPPPDIVMTDFEKHKIAGDTWFSPPFYSHIGGYKMGLRVDANGDGVGEATHVSVFFCLHRGEYDDQLKWPFRGDITIQLLNQSRDEGHWEMTVHFNDRAPDYVAARVVGKERDISGWGYSKFIGHTELKTGNKEYLKKDSLKFRTSTIVVKSV